MSKRKIEILVDADLVKKIERSHGKNNNKAYEDLLKVGYYSV